MHDRIADDAFRRQVLAELRESLATPLQGTYGTETNELIPKLLEQAEQPNTELSRGVVEAFFFALATRQQDWPSPGLMTPR